MIIGMFLLIKGADYFVNGASAVAKKMKVPAIIIGLTIVAFGTSLPELSVSIVSAISGNIDMSIGNIVGSNLFNMLFILGFAALFSPIVMNKDTNKGDFSFMIITAGLLLVFSLDRFFNGVDANILSRTESFMLLGVLVIYLTILIKKAYKSRQEQLSKGKKLKVEKVEIEPENTTEEKDLKTWQMILYLILGLSAVVFGGECVASTAEYLALQMGMSEALVGLTIVAFGTSLPELVTSVVASKKGENDLALGNVVGSNIMNIALILGSVGAIAQAPVSSVILTDIAILLGCTVLFVTICMLRKKIGRLEGVILMCIYLAYIAFAIVRNYCF